MEIGTLIELAAAAKNWITTFHERRVLHQDRLNDALRALYAAASETEIYVARQGRAAGNKNRRSREKEEKLSRLWRDASVLIREFDHDLADRCFIKGGYWIEPELWTEDAIRTARIELKQVIKESRELLWT